ncbi:MAG: D-amino-acid oxidase, partial [Arcticibacterium sp.]
MNRKDFINTAFLGGLALGSQGIISCASQPKHYADSLFHIKKSSFTIPKLKLSSDRIIKETVGLRPFRSKGPRVEKEILGRKTLVHNYGHGGSGWSLSWGTGNQARNLVLSTGVKEVALIGCGVVGIATATLLQESGIDVIIYTKDVPPNVTSNLATGTWSPASRVCDKSVADSGFEAKWKDATQFSFRRLQMMLGVEDVVQWTDE